MTIRNVEYAGYDKEMIEAFFNDLGSFLDRLRPDLGVSPLDDSLRKPTLFGKEIGDTRTLQRFAETAEELHTHLERLNPFLTQVGNNLPQAGSKGSELDIPMIRRFLHEARRAAGPDEFAHLDALTMVFNFALRHGWYDTPVVLMATYDQMAAFGIEELPGIPVKGKGSKTMDNRFVSSEEAERFLTDHAGFSGRFLVTLMRAGWSHYSWVISVQRNIVYFAYPDAKKPEISDVAFGGSLGYGRLDAFGEPFKTEPGFDGPGFVCMLDEVLKRVDVIGANQAEATLAGVLVNVASHNAIAFPETNLPLEPLGDDQLGALLRAVFRKRPDIVIQAILAMRRARPGLDGWLFSVIRSRPDFYDLAGAISRELG